MKNVKKSQKKVDAFAPPEPTVKQLVESTEAIAAKPEQPKGVPVISPPDLEMLRLLKALISARNATVNLQESILLRRLPGQRKEVLEAEALARLQLVAALEYVKGERDAHLQKRAAEERKEDLERQMLMLGPTAEYAVAK